MKPPHSPEPHPIFGAFLVLLALAGLAVAAVFYFGP